VQVYQVPKNGVAVYLAQTAAFMVLRATHLTS